MGSGGSGIPGASFLNYIVLSEAFKNFCFTLNNNLSTVGTTYFLLPRISCAIL
jgi:hypothetical protein